ncbi:hypothetical protein [Bacillus sp. FJAT-45350]|uniref:hypothetical protein n=1 Tax=Bacillus sp. FJAT-45350 TaxID=2011014 RepID=UPI000BB73C42|nr:hypothetical protein [Bacillus sp. FJAT-45350]
MENNIRDLITPEIENEINQLTFTKNFRSATAEEWFIFHPHYSDPKSGGAFGKIIIHYDLQGNRDIFLNTTIIIDDETLYDKKHHTLVYAIADETINRLVGYANTLVAVHSGGNSYNAEYIRN